MEITLGGKKKKQWNFTDTLILFIYLFPKWILIHMGGFGKDGLYNIIVFF